MEISLPYTLESLWNRNFAVLNAVASVILAFPLVQFPHCLDERGNRIVQIHIAS